MGMDARVDQARSQRGFLASLNDFLRWLLFVVLTTAAIAAVVFYFVHERLDDEIRRYVEGQFRAHYRDLQVTVRSARRIPGVGIELRGVSLRAPPGPPRDRLGRAIWLTWTKCWSNATRT